MISKISTHQNKVKGKLNLLYLGTQVHG